jgi:DNA polymerase-3 subunit beta
MKIIQIDRNHLRAALHTSSVRDIRYYLNGVCVEVMQGQTRIISTDGTVLSVFRTMIENPEHAQFTTTNLNLSRQFGLT